MVKFLDLRKVTALHGDEIREAMQRVVESGWYLRGEETRRFEEAYARYIGTRHCVGVGNGLDALTLIYRAYIELGLLSKGDEVLVPANTYIASILAITENGLRPVLMEPRWDTLELDDTLLEQHLTNRTRSLLLVHLYGRCAYTERIGTFCRQHGLLLVEDNAQAHGARVLRISGVSKSVECEAWSEDGFVAESNLTSPSTLLTSPSTLHTSHKTGSLGHAAGHSFYPGKNLGALGDAGAVTTDDDRLAEAVRALGNYGSQEKYVFDYKGRNSRMDELQAAVLSVKLQHLDEDNARRRQIARRYEAEIRNQLITLPTTMPDGANVYHLFPILCEQRDALQRHLAEHGVETIIHYPVPPHRQKCYAEWNTLSLPTTERIHRCELSLPISPAMTDKETDEVIRRVNEFGSV